MTQHLPTAQSVRDSLVGTWRWDSITEGASGTEHTVTEAFFMRFYANGTLATWPTPWHEVSHGRFDVKDGKLVLLDLPTVGSKTIPMSIKNGKLTMVNEDGDAVVYHRILPNLDPGQLP
jgi:hypothetical protein